MWRWDWALGLDLGEVADYTAVAAIRTLERGERVHYQVAGLERFKRGETAPLDFASDPSMAYWDRVIKYLGKRLRSHEFYRRTAIAIDATGIGRPVVRQICQSPEIRDTAAPLYPFEFRGDGAKEHQRVNGLIRVTRRSVLSAAQIAMDQGRLKIAAGLRDAKVLEAELKAVRIEERRGDVEDGRQRQHDDQVFAIGLAVYLVEVTSSQGVGGWMPLRYQ